MPSVGSNFFCVAARMTGCRNDYVALTWFTFRTSANEIALIGYLDSRFPS